MDDLSWRCDSFDSQKSAHKSPKILARGTRPAPCLLKCRRLQTAAWTLHTAANDLAEPATYPSAEVCNI